MDHPEDRTAELRGRIEAIRAAAGGRYHSEAYLFVMDVVAFTLQDIGEMRHITGRELCEGAQRLALSRFGPMAKEVLNFWGVLSTEDIGNVVFDLAEAGELSTTEEDSIADFIDVFEFDEAFERDYYS